MDPMGEEQLDYGDDEYGGGQKLQFQGSGAIPALADEELIGEDDEYDDLYNDVNVGEGFMQSMHHRNEAPIPFGGVGNGGFQSKQIDGPSSKVPDNRATLESIPGVGVDSKASNVGGSFSNVDQKRTNFSSAKGVEGGAGNYPDGVSQKAPTLDMAPVNQVENIGFRGSAPMPPKIGTDSGQMQVKFSSGPSSLPDPGSVGARNGPPMLANPTGTAANQPMVNENAGRPILDTGPTMLFVGELHWWTTDAELENVLSQYGRVKEIKFYDERASGKSKGYCHVEFYDAAAAAACKDSMNGHVFNGRACVVAFASPQTVRQMGASYMNKNQGQTQVQTQGRRPMNDGVGRGGGMNYQGGDGGRNYGRGGWGRGGGQGSFNRGQGGGPMRGRGAMGGRGMVGNTGGMGGNAAGGPYGQGLAGSALGGPAGGLMHPQSMMGAAFDPTYMGRGAGYGGFPGAAFPGMMPSFPAVNAVTLPGVAPHVNPAFFGRGMAANGMGMMGATGMEGHQQGMWTDTSMVGWGASGGDEHGRTRESSYGADDVASDYGYGETGHERGGRSNASREKDRGSERDWSSNSDRRHRDERELDRDRSDRYREEKDGYRDHRPRERDWDNEDDWDRGQSSSRPRSKSRIMQEDDHRSRSRDADYGKRRRMPSE
ncbi:RNA recognition motif domain-containing protein [Cinnamomum micranthum f. kanehirae]|uniref:RNA recognition motif domain-containing protein n=1 Tax=Cinnamomum micranthum f. kanehirae TaxID=337451 RepID=A0A3S3P5T6_9MAGN|nr:RNA recognition motif domain-containing protein [Cinnamomum micranthum f. kanehirae]